MSRYPQDLGCDVHASGISAGDISVSVVNGMEMCGLHS